MATLTATTPITALPQVPNPSFQATAASLPSLSSQNPSLSSNVHRGPLTASLNFYGPPSDNAAPYNYVELPPEGVPRFNYTYDAHSIDLSDARGSESNFSLDRNAFALVENKPHNPSIDWSSDASVRKTYYPEVEALLLEQCPGAKRILLFDHTIRRASPTAHRAPVTRAHIDQTAKSAAQRVRFHLPPEEAEEALKSRYRIVNVWRPINGPVESFPLAFADSQTVDEKDVVGIEHRYPDRTGETAGVKWAEGQRWWYWSGVGEEERVLLCCFDSQDEGVRVPHSAFVDPRGGEGAKPRESVEVRALVFG